MLANTLLTRKKLIHLTRLIDLNQTVFVPVVDESKGGAEYEIKMTLAEFFKKCLPDFEPEIVDAIPTEWILSLTGDSDTYELKFRHAWSTLVSLWGREQEGAESNEQQ